MGKHFDELSKALASGVSRRQALRRFVGGALGAMLATAIPGRAASADVDAEGRGGELLRVCANCCRGLQGEDFRRCVRSCLRSAIFNGNHMNFTC